MQPGVGGAAVKHVIHSRWNSAGSHACGNALGERLTPGVAANVGTEVTPCH